MDCEHNPPGSNELVILRYEFLSFSEWIHGSIERFTCLEDEHEDLDADSLAKLRPANQHISWSMWRKCGLWPPPQHI